MKITEWRAASIFDAKPADRDTTFSRGNLPVVAGSLELVDADTAHPMPSWNQWTVEFNTSGCVVPLATPCNMMSAETKHQSTLSSKETNRHWRACRKPAQYGAIKDALRPYDEIQVGKG